MRRTGPNKFDCGENEVMREKNGIFSDVNHRISAKRLHPYRCLRSRIVLVMVTALLTWFIQSVSNRCELKLLNELPTNTLDFHSPLTLQKPRDISLKNKIDLSSYTGPAREFPIFQHPFPCFPEEEGRYLMLDTPAQEGFFFQRPKKTGSTTVSGIVMRIAHRRKLPGTRACRHRAYHGFATKYGFNNRTIGKSFLFSLLREPTKRAISHFFHFAVSATQVEPTDENFKKVLRRRDMEDVYIRDLAMRSGWEERKDNKTKVVEEILNAYDFIAVTERMDESLVVLKILLNLKIEDILYLSERTQGGFSNGPPKDRPCIYIIPSFLTPGMKKFFASEEWAERMEGDNLMYAAAVKSLDLTIDALGRKKVEREVRRFRIANNYAKEKCQSQVRSLCDEGGERASEAEHGAHTTCYIWGEGCAHACLDKLHLRDPEFEQR